MNTTQTLDTDILIAGGGLSGVCCALAASRDGARVILVQDRPVLGGNASSEIRMHVVGADCHGSRSEELACEAREGGLIEEIRLDLCVQNPQRSPSMFDLLLYDKCRREPNLTLLLNSTLAGAEMQDGRLAAVIVERRTTEDVFRITANHFVDATGDGRLGAEAGADFRRGRESRSEFGERFALPDPDDCTLGSSLLFTASQRENDVEFQAPPWARHFEAEDLNHRLHLRPGVEAAGLEYGFWWLEWGGHLDTIKDNEAIRDELLSIVLGVWHHIKNSGRYPGVERWALDWIGFVPGKRESRRLEGPHILTQHDVEGGKAHDDDIAYGGWWMDLHPPEGVDAPEEKPCIQHHFEHLYGIPLRCCFSRNIPNLWMAGRNISATHVAFASTRVMATCAAIGQGVGLAAAAAARWQMDPAAIVADPQRMRSVREAILREDGFLLGAHNEDPLDVARLATASANSEAPDGPAANILTGRTRSVHGRGGARPDYAAPGTHRWISRNLPATLELRWDHPVTPREIRLVFDTGMHRELTFSLSGHCNRRILWGRGQPETVCGYRLTGTTPDGRQIPLGGESGNHQRLRIVRPEAPEPVTRLRIEVVSTHGVDHARICEVRVYE